MKKERYTYKRITIEAIPKGRCRDCYLESKIFNNRCDATKAKQFKIRDCVIDRNEGEYVHFKIVKLHKKPNEKELMIRKFRKFLYDNDELETWYKNVKSSRWESTPKCIFAKYDPNYWICKAFPWPHTKYHMWNNLNEMWSYMISKYHRFS